MSSDSDKDSSAQAQQQPQMQAHDEEEMSSIGLGTPPVMRQSSSGGSSTGTGAAVVTGPSSPSASSSSSSGSALPLAVVPVTPFDLLCPGPEIRLTDYVRVTHSFSIVSGQVAHGLDALKAVADFIKRVCAAKDNYAAALLTTSGQFAAPMAATADSKGPSSASSKAGGEHHPSSSMFSEDAMGSSVRIWGELREQLFEEARQEQEFSASVLEQVVAPMLSFHAEAARRARVLNAHQQALAGQLRTLTEGQLLQAKIASVRLLQALAAAEARERESSAAWRATASQDALVAPVPAPPVHLKGEDPSNSGGGSSSSSSSGGARTGTTNLERSTRRALASVGSFFKNLKGKKEPEKKDAPLAAAAAAPGDGAEGAVAIAGAITPSSSAAAASSASASSSSSAVADSASALAIHGGESSEELRDRAYQSALAYQLAVASANARQEQYYSSDLPQLFAELQRLEVGRLNCLKHCLGLLAGANLSLVGPNKQRVQSLLQSVASMHSESDTRDFAMHIVAQVGEAVKPNSFVYDLAVTPEIIRSARMESPAAAAAVAAAAVVAAPVSASVAGPAAAVSCFTSSLSAQMDLAESQGCGHDLNVPRVFHVLVQAIRERRGYHKPGLFFTAAPVGDVGALRARFEAGDFSTAHASLDVLAATLKAWLRALPEPLLPAPLYSAAIQSIKKDATSQLAERHAMAEAAALAAAKPSSSSSAPANAPSLDGVDRTSNPAAAAAGTPPAPAAAPAAGAGAERPRAASSVGSPSNGLVLPPRSESNLPSPQLHMHVQSILSALPTLNQRLLMQLAALLSDMAAANSQVLVSAVPPSSPRLVAAAGEEVAPPVNVGVNGTTIDWNRWANSIAHNAPIFASALLRNAHADATELLANSKNEVRFTAALFMSVAQVLQAKANAVPQQQPQQQSQVAAAPAADEEENAPSQEAAGSQQQQQPSDEEEEAGAREEEAPKEEGREPELEE